MPPVPPLVTSTVAVDRNGNAWLYEPAGIAKPLDLMPLGSTNPGTTPPANPQTGWLWWDTGVNELKAWDGTAWIASSGGGSGGIGEPTTAGSFLRTNTGTWVGGLPLSGGTMTNATIIAADTGNIARWSLNLTGAGATQNFEISRYNGAGTAILSTPLAIDRTTGQITTAGQLNVSANFNQTGGTFFVTNATQNLFSNSTGSASLVIRKAASGSTVSLQGQTAASNRWMIILGDATAEAAPQTGSNFAIQRYSNTNVLIDSPLTIDRATGAVTIPNLQGYLPLVRISVAEPASAQDGEIWIKDVAAGTSFDIMIRIPGAWLNIGNSAPGPW